MEKESESIYLEYRNHLIESRRQTYGQFDKAIFLLSGGGLTVSLTLLKDIIPIQAAKFKPLVAWSWGFFTLSLVFTLFSFISSRRAIDKQLQNAEDYFVKNDPEAKDRINIYAKITEFINYSSAVSFMAGLIIFLVFVYINFFKEV